MEKRGINITTKELVENSERILNKNRQEKDRRDYKLKLDTQIKLENEFLSSYKQCEHLDKSKVVTNLPSLDLEKLKHENDDRFYNSGLMKAVSCVTSSLSIVVDDKSITGNERLRNYIKKLRQIGTDSVNGYAMSASLSLNDDTINNFFVMKVPKNINSAQELVHECMVAFGATNELRKYVPNYSYVYGMVKCSQPYIENKEVITWCSMHENIVAYAIYENVPLGDNVSNFAKKCSAEEFMMYYLQILFALREGYNRFGFTHYDLHTENVLLRKTNKTDFFIPYNSKQGVIYLKSKEYIATIIDYGMSHIEIEENDGRVIHYGSPKKNSYESAGVYIDSSNIIIDVYKLLCFSLSDMANNKESFAIVSELLKYFNKTETPKQIIARQSPGETWYYLPKNEETEKFNLDDFIDYCLKFCSENDIHIIQKNKPENVLGCDDTCKTFIQEMDYLGVNGDTPLPNTFFQFYDTVDILKYRTEYLISSKKDEKYILEEFGNKLPEILEKEIENMKDTFSLIQKSRDFVLYKIPDDLNLLFNKEVFSNIKLSAKQYVELFDLENYINTYYKIITFVKNAYNIKESFTRFNDFYDKIKDDKEYMNEKMIELKEHVKEDINFITKNLDEYKNKVKNTEYAWYFDTFPLLA